MPRLPLLSLVACAVVACPETSSAQLSCTPESVVPCDVDGAAALRPSLQNRLLLTPTEGSPGSQGETLSTTTLHTDDESWWTPGRFVAVTVVGIGAIFGIVGTWGRDQDNPDSIRSRLNILQGAVLGIAVVGIGFILGS